MAASHMFENILDQVKSSNLNFHLQLSPFSAIISLKKSWVKDKTGTSLLRPPTPTSILFQTHQIENEASAQKISKLETIIKSLRSDYEDSLRDCENAYRNIAKLEN